MAKLFITEFVNNGINNQGLLNQVALCPSAADQAIAITAGSTQSAALNAATNFVRVTADVICSIKFGADPTATTDTMRLAAGAVEYFGVTAGASLKIAVIANT